MNLAPKGEISLPGFPVIIPLGATRFVMFSCLSLGNLK